MEDRCLRLLFLMEYLSLRIECYKNQPRVNENNKREMVVCISFDLIAGKFSGEKKYICRSMRVSHSVPIGFGNLSRSFHCRRFDELEQLYTRAGGSIKF